MSQKSIPLGRIDRLSDCLTPLVARPPKRPIHPLAGLGLPPLDPHIMALRPHARLEDQSETDGYDEYSSRPRKYADDRRQEQEDHSSPEKCPFHNRMVEEIPP